MTFATYYCVRDSEMVRFLCTVKPDGSDREFLLDVLRAREAVVQVDWDDFVFWQGRTP